MLPTAVGPLRPPGRWHGVTAVASKGPVTRSWRAGTVQLGPPGRGVLRHPFIRIPRPPPPIPTTDAPVASLTRIGAARSLNPPRGVGDKRSRKCDYSPGAAGARSKGERSCFCFGGSSDVQQHPAASDNAVYSKIRFYGCGSAHVCFAPKPSLFESVVRPNAYVIFLRSDVDLHQAFSR